MKKIIIAGLLLSQVQAELMSQTEYEPLKACEKQKVLWKEIERTKYKSLPDFENVGPVEVLKMRIKEVYEKANKQGDFSPKGWHKYLHRRGTTATVKIVARENNSYTGVFEGADCALLRLSLTYKPSEKNEKPVAPGMALKVFRNDTYSANVSALYTLEGQEYDYNFFKNPLSNIVPINKGWKFKAVHWAFSKVTDFPEELGLDHLAKWNAKGIMAEKMNAPRQIFFVPNEKVSTPSEKHDIRESIAKIEPGTKLYTIYALPNKTEEMNYRDFDYYHYKNEDIEKFKSAAIPIADVITTSPFVASSFGDTGIFYRHEVIEK